MPRRIGTSLCELAPSSAIIICRAKSLIYSLDSARCTLPIRGSRRTKWWGLDRIPLSHHADGYLAQLVTAQLMSYGPLENVRVIPNSTVVDNASAAIAKFRYRDDAVRCHAALRKNPAALVNWTTSSAESSEVDPCAIFVGNLPSDISRAELETTFGNHGEVVAISIVRKLHGSNHAIITYTSPLAAHSATEHEHDTVIGNHRIRVALRELAKDPAVRARHRRQGSDGSYGPQMQNNANNASFVSPPMTPEMKRGMVGPIANC